MIVRRLIETALASLLATTPAFGQDSDRDGLPDATDTVPSVSYTPGFAATNCAAMDLDPSNDSDPECKARERVAGFLASQQGFVQKIAFSVVKSGEVHFADAFARNTSGQVIHDPGGIHRLFRIGSTTKSMTAVAAKVLEERAKLSLTDYVSDDDASRLTVGGKRTLRHLLSHQGAFKLDTGHIYLFGYPGTLQAFWKEKGDSVSPPLQQHQLRQSRRRPQLLGVQLLARRRLSREPLRVVVRRHPPEPGVRPRQDGHRDPRRCPGEESRDRRHRRRDANELDAPGALHQPGQPD
jgi:CubicO group peptidase (beta-lactamase class C family)